MENNQLTGNLNSSITNKLQTEVVKQFEKTIILGLEKKGYVFTSQSELESFVKENCEVYRDYETKIQTYYVKSEPFLQYEKSFETTMETNLTNHATTIQAKAGKFTFL